MCQNFALTPFQNLHKQADAFQQSQPQPRFKEPQPQPPKDKRKKRVAKRATVDLVDENDEEDEPIRQCAPDRSEDLFWGQIMDDFNTSTTQGYRTRHMLTGKWTRINGDCQKFNAIYKHLERKSRKNEADHIEAAKITFAAQQPTGRKFQLEHYVRPRPARKNRPVKKTKSETTESTGGSASGSLSDYVYEDLRRKLQAETSAYEAKKEKEVAMMEFKEMEFLTIDADLLLEPKASIIRNRQEKIIAKYAQQ
ncbi:hypothetical protein Tco_1085898 [Tanacetum coccineum]